MMIDTTAAYLSDDDLSDPELAELFAALHAQGSGTPPSMGAALSAALGAASAPSALAPRRDRRTAHRAGVAALLATGLVSVGVGAAAAGVLPDPAQRVISNVVARLTPIELPRPHHSTPRRLEPTPGPGNVAPVDPERFAESELTDRDGGTEPTEPTEPSPSLEARTQDADEGTGERESESESESERVESPEGDTTGTGSDTAEGDSSGSGAGGESDRESDEGSDARDGEDSGSDGQAGE